MSRYIARIIRAAIVSILGFGGGVGLLVFIATLVLKGDQNAFHYGLMAGLVIGGIFAVFLVGVLLPLDLSSHLFLSGESYDELWELEQTREVCFQGTLREATAACREALLSVPNVKSITEDMQNLLIRADIGTSWKSGGESIDVEINPLSEDKWQIRCTSKPLSTSIVFDYGKNFENVQTWLKNMSQSMAKGLGTS
jgi:hypothetical protein